MGVIWVWLAMIWAWTGGVASVLEVVFKKIGALSVQAIPWRPLLFFCGPFPGNIFFGHITGKISRLIPVVYRGNIYFSVPCSTFPKLC